MVLFIAAFALPVASGPPSRALPDSAKAIARLLEEHYHHAQTLRAVFLERYSEGPREARIESGTVYFRRPGRMRWEYESPEKKLFVADGKTVWFYVPADHTVTRVPGEGKLGLAHAACPADGESRSLPAVQPHRSG